MPALGCTAEDLVNRGNTLLGEEEIDSLTDDDDLSMTCARCYSVARDEVLGLYAWRCLLKREQLARLSAAPTNGWTYAFQLPTDRVGEIEGVWNTDDVDAPPFKDYDIVGDQLFSNEEELWAEYPWAVNEDALPAHLRTLIVFVYAARAAEPLTEDQAKANKWEMEAYGTPGEGRMGGYFATARRLDSRSRPSQELAAGTDYELINVRG